MNTPRPSFGQLWGSVPLPHQTGGMKTPRPSTGPLQPPGYVNVPTPQQSGRAMTSPPSCERLSPFSPWASTLPSARSTPLQTSSDVTRTHLCSELVVPDGSECTLLMQRIPPQGSQKHGYVSVDDARGSPVFRASFVLGDQQTDNRRLIFASASGDAVFAFCRDAEPETAPGNHQLGLTIHHHWDTLFGVLRAKGRGASRCYAVVTGHGLRTQVRGDIRTGNLNATDEHGRLLALVEPFGPEGSGQRSVRIGPHVDAGLIVIALLGIDLLEYAASTRK